MSGGVDSLTPDSDEENALEAVVVGAVSTVTFIVGFGLLALGVPWFWIAFPVGFGGILPAAIGLTKLYQDEDEPGDQSTPTDEEALETLRERYARGEIDEKEFERRVEALLETESVETAADYTSHEKARE